MKKIQKQQRLENLRVELIALPDSALVNFRRQNHYQPVVGAGNPDARIMFIGEAPGRQEAETGRPFVGAAGKVLDLLLNSIALKRDQIFITALVHDRPPGNRDPTVQEIQVYSPFLHRIIEIVQPAVLVPLGRFASRCIIEKYSGLGLRESMTQIHGRQYQGCTTYGEITIVPLYHPAYTLYGGVKRSLLLEDMQVVGNILKK